MLETSHGNLEGPARGDFDCILISSIATALSTRRGWGGGTAPLVNSGEISCVHLCVYIVCVCMPPMAGLNGLPEQETLLVVMREEYVVSKRMLFTWACKRGVVGPCQDGA